MRPPGFDANGALLRLHQLANRAIATLLQPCRHSYIFRVSCAHVALGASYN